MFDLTGHTALVTGGNSGIGLAYAKGLVKCGAKVAIWGRKEDKNAAALEELRALGGDVESYINSGQLTKINKEDNYRCSEDVITFINQIRNDGLEQKLAFKTKNGLTETGEERQGEVKLYYSIYSEERTPGGTPKDKVLYSQILNSIITIVQEKHPSFKKLVLTNKSISGELGFNNLFETFSVSA